MCCSGDGAGAAVLGLSEEEGIIATYLGSDGGGAHLLNSPPVVLECQLLWIPLIADCTI